MNELKECPFCGSNNIHIDNILSEDDNYFMIQCDNCDASACFGDASEVKDNAIKAWNNRKRRG